LIQPFHELKASEIAHHLTPNLNSPFHNCVPYNICAYAKVFNKFNDDLASDLTTLSLGW